MKLLTLGRESFSMRAELYAHHSSQAPLSLTHVLMLRCRNQQIAVSQILDSRLVASSKSANFQAKFPQPPLRIWALGRLERC